jgi:hypothetical protein
VCAYNMAYQIRPATDGATASLCGTGSPGGLLPYLDLGQSPLKTLGRPTGRVKAFCVPFGVPSATESGGDAVMRWGNHTPGIGDGQESRTEPRQAA